MKDLGLKVGNTVTQRAVEQIPGRLLVELNKRIGAKLAAQVGQAGSQVDRGGRLSHAALLVGNADYPAHETAAPPP